MTNSGYSSNKMTYGILLVSIVMIGFFIFHYPAFNDFIFGNMDNSYLIQKSAHVAKFNVPGFDVFNTELALISNIPYTILPSLPIPLIPTSLIFFCLLWILYKFKRSLDEVFIFILALIYLLSDYSTAFVWSPHVAGISLLLMLLFLIVKRIKPDEEKKKIDGPVSLLIIITLISLNFISYKLTFLALTLMIFLHLLNVYQDKTNFKSPYPFKKTNFTQLILIGSIVALYFNEFFYRTFLPTILEPSETEFSSANIFAKLLHSFSKVTTDSLSPYYFKNLTQLTYANTFFLSTILIIVSFVVILCIIKLIKREKYSYQEFVFSSLIMSTACLFLIYAGLGLPDFGIITIAAFIGFLILKDKLIFKDKTKKLFIGVLITIIIVSTFATGVIRITNNVYSEQRDNNGFVYLNYPSKWIISYGDIITKSDILSESYFSLIRSQEGSKKKVTVLSNNEFLEIINENEINKSSLINSNVIINKKIDRFYLSGWNVMNGWKNMEQEINNNNHLNIVYTSGNVDIIKIIENA